MGRDPFRGTAWVSASSEFVALAKANAQCGGTIRREVLHGQIWVTTAAPWQLASPPLRAVLGQPRA